MTEVYLKIIYLNQSLKCANNLNLNNEFIKLKRTICLTYCTSYPFVINPTRNNHIFKKKLHLLSKTIMI